MYKKGINSFNRILICDFKKLLDKVDGGLNELAQHERVVYGSRLWNADDEKNIVLLHIVTHKWASTSS